MTKEEVFKMGTHQFTEYLVSDSEVGKGSDELEIKHEQLKEVIKPNKPMLTEQTPNAKGRDKLFASKALGAGTDIVNEQDHDRISNEHKR